MRIEEAELRLVPLRLRTRFEISSGARQDRSVLLLALRADGVEGWGECVAAEDPSYSYETTETAWHVLTRFLLPGIVGSRFEEPGRVLDPVGWVRGHPMARAAVEMAAWDLVARREGRSLSEVLGGTRDSVEVGVSIGLQPDDDALLSRVESRLQEGYRRVKLKVKPGRDVEMVRRVRDRFPEATVMVDANSAYTLEDRTRLAELDDLDLLMIEQPLAWDDLRDHARLQESLRTPICLDESIRSVRDASLALELGSCRIINVKPGRVGGFSSARAIHDLCLEHGVPLWVGGMLESGVGRAHNVALASLPGFTLPGDISESRRYWERDVVVPEFVMEDGRMPVPDGPGMGVRPDRSRIEELTARRQRFVA
jgi:O-succinylbenzoate synthase